MTEDSKIAAEDQQPDERQTADPYHAKSITLAEQAMSTVGNVINMVMNSGDDIAIGLFIFRLTAMTEAMWQYAQKNVPPEAMKESEEVKEQMRNEITERLSEIIPQMQGETNSNSIGVDS